jgi:hypothetical protein
MKKEEPLGTKTKTVRLITVPTPPQPLTKAVRLVTVPTPQRPSPPPPDVPRHAPLAHTPGQGVSARPDNEGRVCCSNAQKTMPRQNRSIVSSNSPCPSSVTAVLRQGLRVEPFTRTRGRLAPPPPDVHRYEPPVRTSR